MNRGFVLCGHHGGGKRCRVYQCEKASRKKSMCSGTTWNENPFLCAEHERVDFPYADIQEDPGLALTSLIAFSSKSCRSLRSRFCTSSSQRHNGSQNLSFKAQSSGSIPRVVRSSRDESWHLQVHFRTVAMMMMMVPDYNRGLPKSCSTPTGILKRE